MSKHFIVSACAVALLAVGQADAQSPPAPTGGPSPPPTISPSLPSGPGGAVNGSRRASSSATPVGVATFVSRQASDQWLASALMSKSMYGVDGQPVGEVKDILIDRGGNIAAIVVDVGGAVGAAGKIVAVPFSSIQVSRDANNNDRLVLQATRTDLQNAPAFAAQDRDSTLGAGAGRPADSSGSGASSGGN